MVDQPARWRPPFTQLQLREMWTYSDDARTVKAYRQPGDTGTPGSWTLVDPATGNVHGHVQPGEFSRRFRPVDVFAEVTGFPTFLGTVTASDGAALVDLILDRNPFMLASGPRRAARPHVLIVPRQHRDGWSSATTGELAARHTAMILVAAWYRSLDGGHVVFAANDSPPNLDYLGDLDYPGDAAPAPGTLAGRGSGAGTGRNPRQDVQHAHLHAFYAEPGETENHESPAANGHPVIAVGYRAFSDDPGSDAVRVDGDAASLATEVRRAAQPWGGSYCSYQRGVDGAFWVMPALGAAQDEFNRRLAQADGLRVEADPKLGGAVNLARPSLADADRARAAQRATVEQRAGFERFIAQLGLNHRSLPEALVLEPPPAR